MYRTVSSDYSTCKAVNNTHQHTYGSKGLCGGLAGNLCQAIFGSYKVSNTPTCTCMDLELCSTLVGVELKPGKRGNNMYVDTLWELFPAEWEINV